MDREKRKKGCAKKKVGNSWQTPHSARAGRTAGQVFWSRVRLAPQPASSRSLTQNSICCMAAEKDLHGKLGPETDVQNKIGKGEEIGGGRFARRTMKVFNFILLALPIT